MKRLIVALAALSLAAPACAGSYRVVLQKPENGKLLFGHAGVQAADERNDRVLIRVISPGNQVKERGTVRVLVMNFGSTPFEFGPDQVKLELDGGTTLAPTDLGKFVKGKRVIDNQMRIERAIDLNVRSNLAALTGAGGGGQSPGAGGPGSFSGTAPGGENPDVDFTVDDSRLAGSNLLDALDQLLLPLTVGPNQAWGGYYVFDMPKAVFDRRADQPLTIVVTTGAEKHRFPATLHWK